MAERATTLGRRLVDKRRALEKAKTAAKLAQEEHDEAERAFWDRLEDENDTTVTKELGEGYGKVQFVRRETIRANVRNKDRAARALRDADLADTMLEDFGIRQKPLTDHVKHCIKTGEPLPDGVDFSAKRYVQITYKDTDDQEE